MDDLEDKYMNLLPLVQGPYFGDYAKDRHIYFDIEFLCGHWAGYHKND